jgi:hypothetical protein
MYYNAEIGQWLSGFYCREHRRPYKQVPGQAISSETDSLIAQNVHGSKLIKFEISEKVQGKQWIIFHFISFILHSVNPYKVCNLSDIELVMI